MNLKNHEKSAEYLVSQHHQRPGTKQEKFDQYILELKAIAEKHKCKDLLNLKNEYRTKKGDFSEDPPELDAAMMKAKQVTVYKALELLVKSNSPLAKSLAKALKKRRVAIFMASVGTEHGKDNGKIHELGSWDPSKEQFNDGAIIIGDEYIGNYIGAAGVIAHELRHIMDCEESMWDEKRDENGNIIRKKLDIGFSMGKTDYGLNADLPQERANIYSGGLLAELGWNSDSIWTKMSATDKDALREKWGPDWDGMLSTSGVCSNMDEKMKLFLTKHYHVRDKINKKKCGRICRNKRYGICDREINFPPCWDHR